MILYVLYQVDIGAAVLASLPLGAVNLPGNVQRRRTDEDELQMRETLRMLDECIEKSLEGNVKYIFGRHYVEGWKHRDLSKLFDVPMGTVGPQLSRSREKVSSCMKEKGYGT